MDARDITKALGGKWAGRYGLARCPVHDDRTPSLKVSDDPRKDDGIDVVCFANCDWRDVKAALVRQGLLPEFKPTSFSTSFSFTTPPPAPDRADEAVRVDLALKIWDAAGPLKNSLGWRYFTERRGLHVGLLDLDHCLRFHVGFSAVVALMTDAITNEPVGVHRTFLKADATKNVDQGQKGKKMLGKQGVIRLSPDEIVTDGLGITEGIETGARHHARRLAPGVVCDFLRRHRAPAGDGRHRAPDNLRRQRPSRNTRGTNMRRPMAPGRA